jgi:hypothetical protein
MPRPRKHTPTVRREIQLPADLDAILSRLHYNPVLDRPDYGAFTKYIIALIRQDLAKRSAPSEKNA